MTAGTAWRLAGPRAGRRVIAAAVAVTGALALYVLHLARATIQVEDGMASFVYEGGLRVGVMTGAVLLSVPVLALALQALRMGSVERDRRLAALRLAGLTPRELRVVSGIEAGRAAGAGAVFAGPAYLALYVLGGVLPSIGARVVAPPDAGDVVTWLLLIPTLAALAGAAGAIVAEYRPDPRPGAASRVGLLAGGAGVVLSLNVYAVAGGDALLFTAIAGLVVFAFASGPWLVLGAARLLERRRGAESLLAARRLRADPRTTGRVAGVLIVCGVALSVEALLVYQAIVDPFVYVAGETFFIAGYSAAAAAMLCGAVVAIIALLLGTADSLLAARRPLAALTVFGVDERTLLRVLTRQLLATAVSAITLGALLGGATLIALVAVVSPDAFPAVGLALLLGAGVALAVGLVFALVTVLAVRLLRSLVRAAIDPQNLRAA